MLDSYNSYSHQSFRDLESRHRGRKHKAELLFASEHKHPGKGRPRRRGHHLRDGRTRIPRGDIKYLLLSLLAEKPQHGYQLIREIELRWGGFYRPSPGSVYPTLQLLEEGNYLTSEQLEGKKVYTITDSGKELLAQHEPSVSMLDVVEEQPQLIELKTTLRDLKEVITQLTRTGNKTKIEQVVSRLKQLKREIYLMLAEDDS
ncbi:PadR family transcriptional regulator [Crocosphaera chwakensis]|uniref:Transcription regulator PadR N-terminal domain-containing protein n=1 Tax=Crocosphaera chwakensis CCY0110 TaxID=391612 RepID=A3IWR1_9CHRO|nr:PadR family transcriptional regulator [Crocosphaera chwakensis]EAZ89066.1 hypothetical protein CY0110_08646 [Crocosphaera chwakensis CCY0110]